MSSGDWGRILRWTFLRWRTSLRRCTGLSRSAVRNQRALTPSMAFECRCAAPAAAKNFARHDTWRHAWAFKIGASAVKSPCRHGCCDNSNAPAPPKAGNARQRQHRKVSKAPRWVGALWLCCKQWARYRVNEGESTHRKGMHYKRRTACRPANDFFRVNHASQPLREQLPTTLAETSIPAPACRPTVQAV